MVHKAIVFLTNMGNLSQIKHIIKHMINFRQIQIG